MAIHSVVGACGYALFHFFSFACVSFSHIVHVCSAFGRFLYHRTALSKIKGRREPCRTFYEAKKKEELPADILVAFFLLPSLLHTHVETHNRTTEKK